MITCVSTIFIFWFWNCSDNVVLSLFFILYTSILNLQIARRRFYIEYNWKRFILQS
jgi:hypothetical protein